MFAGSCLKGFLIKHCDSELLLDNFLSLFEYLAQVKKSNCPTVLRTQKEYLHLTFLLLISKVRVCTCAHVQMWWLCKKKNICVSPNCHPDNEVALKSQLLLPCNNLGVSPDTLQVVVPQIQFQRHFKRLGLVLLMDDSHSRSV